MHQMRVTFVWDNACDLDVGVKQKIIKEKTIWIAVRVQFGVGV
jgi:hypothetical protein